MNDLRFVWKLAALALAPPFCLSGCMVAAVGAGAGRAHLGAAAAGSSANRAVLAFGHGPLMQFLLLYGDPLNAVLVALVRSRRSPLNILVVGAGVIGTIYGGRLALAGHEITVLARGGRLAQIAARGLVLEDALSGERREIRAVAVSAPPADKRFDLVLVTVRDRQLPEILPLLDRLQGRPEILFLLNCPLRVGELVARYGAARILFGFPGAGGVHDGERIKYSCVRQQPTTFGAVAGQDIARAKGVAQFFQQAGFATSVVADMEAWLKTHAFLIVAICGALYASGGISMQLAADAPRLSQLVDGLREGVRCLGAVGTTASPPKLRLMASYLPKPLLVLVLRRFFASHLAALVIDGHANAAPGDMCDLAADCRQMIAASGISAPVMSSLCTEVERRAAIAAVA